MKNLKFLILMLLVVLAGAAFFLTKCAEEQQHQIVELENKIDFLKQETNPIQFMVTERTDTTVSVLYKFLDLKGNEIMRTQATFPGKELSFDFYSVKIGEKYLSFPTKIFTDKIAAADAPTLFEHYDVDNFPAIFETDSLPDASREALKQVFATIKLGQTEQLNNSFGNMVHDVEAFKSFQTETVYSIIAHTKGGIEIVETE